MNPLDIIEIPGYPGLFTRRIVVEMWQRAGSPRINDAGRLFSQQLAARLAFENGTGSPADDPRRPDLYPLAHVRFAALDVVNSARSAMIAAGFEYPYSYEPWHGQLPNIYSYPIVTAIPASATNGSAPFVVPTIPEEEDEMLALNITGPTGVYSCILGRGSFHHLVSSDNAERVKNIVRADDRWTTITLAELPVYLASYGCDERIWDIRNGDFAVLNPLDGSVKAGNVWTIENARFADLVGKITPEVVEPPKA